MAAAGHVGFLGGAFTDNVANHNWAGGNADAHSEVFFTITRRDVSDRPDDAEPGAYRLSGIILVGLRPTEIGQYPDDLGDIATMGFTKSAQAS